MTQNQIKYLCQFFAIFFGVIAAWAVTNYFERRMLAQMAAQRKSEMSDMTVVQQN